MTHQELIQRMNREAESRKGIATKPGSPEVDAQFLADFFTEIERQDGLNHGTSLFLGKPDLEGFLPRKSSRFSLGKPWIVQ